MMKTTDLLQMRAYQDADRIGLTEWLEALRPLMNVLSRNNKKINIKERKN